MSKFASDTSVSVEKTRAELETTLRRFGADSFGYMSDRDQAAITFRVNQKIVRFLLPLPSPAEDRFTRHSRGLRDAATSARLWEQACRASWRALFLVCKAKLVAIESGITTFEQEFLAHIVLPDRRTVIEAALPMIEDAYRTGQQPVFQLALPSSNQ